MRKIPAIISARSAENVDLYPPTAQLAPLYVGFRGSGQAARSRPAAAGPAYMPHSAAGIPPPGRDRPHHPNRGEPQIRPDQGRAARQGHLALLPPPPPPPITTPLPPPH